MALRVNIPCRLVIAFVLVPFTLTVAPSIGFPVASVTFPEIFNCCAKLICILANRNSSSTDSFLIRQVFVLVIVYLKNFLGDLLVVTQKGLYIYLANKPVIFYLLIQNIIAFLVNR